MSYGRKTRFCDIRVGAPPAAPAVPEAFGFRHRLLQTGNACGRFCRFACRGMSQTVSGSAVPGRSPWFLNRSRAARVRAWDPWRRQCGAPELELADKQTRDQRAGPGRGDTDSHRQARRAAWRPRHIGRSGHRDISPDRHVEIPQSPHSPAGRPGIVQSIDCTRPRDVSASPQGPTGPCHAPPPPTPCRAIARRDSAANWRHDTVPPIGGTT